MVLCNIVIVSGLMHQYIFKMYKMKIFFTGSLQTFRFSKETLSLYTHWSFFRLLKCSSHKKKIVNLRTGGFFGEPKWFFYVITDIVFLI